MKAVIYSKNKHLKLTYMQSELQCISVSGNRTHNIVLSFSGSVILGDSYRLNLVEKSVKEKHLDNDAVTTTKIAHEAVETDNIRDESVTVEKLEPRLRKIFEGISDDTEFIAAIVDTNDNYIVKKGRPIVTNDFFATGGAEVEIPNITPGSNIINDNITTTATTWSSTFIAAKLNEKSDENHTHTGYALSTHAHSWEQITNKPNVWHEGNFDPDSKPDRDEVLLADLINNKYFVKEAYPVITSDFLATGGASVEIPDPEVNPIIDDGITSTATTWSSTFITAKLNEKSDESHTHINYSLTTHAHTWGSVTDKPLTFAPSSHYHSWSDITSKPSSFTPSYHNHSWSSITSKPSSFTPSYHRHSWSSITSKPDVYHTGNANNWDVTWTAEGIRANNIQKPDEYYFGSGELGVGIPGALIYTYKKNPIIFFTNGHFERMRVAINGNVGIGTENPVSKLQVAGIGTFKDVIALGS